MPALKVNHLRKAFGDLVAVDDVSFSVDEGSIFGLLGRNGAGKTTCIRMIMNIYPPDEGEVRFGGMKGGTDFNRLVGYLPEERGLYKKMTVLDTLKFFAAVKGKTGPDVIRDANRYLERFELLDRIRTRVEHLSKGNQQKLQFIVSVLHGPKILILDELFSGLDPVVSRLIREILLEMRKQGVVILFSTHVLDFAESMCDGLAIIHRGQNKLTGSVSQIKAEYGKQTVLIQTPSKLDFLTAHADVRNVAPGTGDRIALELSGRLNPQELLRMLVEKGIEINSFEIGGISIEDVFMQVVEQGVDDV